MTGVTLTLVCSAATAAVRAASFSGDEPLDPQGLLAAASAVPFRRVDEVWTSPALRARQTAEAMRLEAKLALDLRDVDYGRWTGRSLDDVARGEPDNVAAWSTDPASTVHGGESIDEVLTRTARWLDITARSEGRIIAVTHAAVIRAAIVTILDAKPSSFWRVDVGPLCRARFMARSGRWTLSSIGAAVPALASDDDRGSRR